MWTAEFFYVSDKFVKCWYIGQFTLAIWILALASIKRVKNWTFVQGYFCILKIEIADLILSLIKVAKWYIFYEN